MLVKASGISFIIGRIEKAYGRWGGADWYLCENANGTVCMGIVLNHSDASSIEVIGFDGEDIILDVIFLRSER